MEAGFLAKVLCSDRFKRPPDVRIAPPASNIGFFVAHVILVIVAALIDAIILVIVAALIDAIILVIVAALINAIILVIVAALINAIIIDSRLPPVGFEIHGVILPKFGQT
jgi:hypothetical protein